MVANFSSSIARGFEFSTFIDVLRDRAIHQPDQEAYCFLTDGELQSARLSYGELDQQVRAVAATLQCLNLRSERALLIYPPGLDFVAAFLGCLYAGVVAVPIYPPRRNFLQVQTVAANAQINAVLTTQALLSNLQQSAVLTEIRHWLPTDTISIQQASDWQPAAIDAEALAFCSTPLAQQANPKA